MALKIENDKQRIMHRLKIIEGQVHGLQNMIDKEEDCEEILKQLSSIVESLRSSGKIIFRKYLSICSREKKLKKDKGIEDIVEVMFKFLK